MRLRRRVAPLCVGALVAAALASCKGETTKPGELMLALQTDMRPTIDFDFAHLRVEYEGDVKYNAEYSANEFQYPATLALQAGSNPDSPVTVRVWARKNGSAVGFQEAITKVPTDRVALLRMPLHWLCNTKVATPDGSPDPVSGCGTGKTCVAGECVSSTIDQATLPTYESGAVFGGGTVSGDGTCFDVLGCFAEGATVAVDAASCSFPLPPGDTSRLSVSLVLPRSVAGICGPEACLVPLDADVSWKVDGDRVVLPAEVCARLATPAPSLHVLSVAITTSCVRKDASVPACGPWSSVGPDLGTFDAGAPDGTFASDAGDGGTSDAGDAEAGDPCHNGAKDGDETDVDCGGSCSKCAPESACAQPSDCGTGVCSAQHLCDCPAGMVLSSRAVNGGVTPFCIDAHEATNADYAEFLQASPQVSGQIAGCDWNTDFEPAQDGGVPSDPGLANLPVVDVDWCDAAAYCAWRGKHLCGAVGQAGAEVAPSDYATAFNVATKSQWFDACSAGGSKTFPYGSGFLPKDENCNGTPASGSAPAGPVAVGTMPKCIGAVSASLFDMSGNVAEWEASCNAASGALDGCRIRGGSFRSKALELACAAQAEMPRNGTSDDVGIRCCAD